MNTSFHRNSNSGDVPVFLSTQSSNQLLCTLQLLGAKVNLVLKVNLLLLVRLQFFLQKKLNYQTIV